MSKKDTKKPDKIKFSEKKDGQKITYEVEKKAEEQTVPDNNKKTTKSFRKVSGNNWFMASAEWKGSEDKDWKKKWESKVGFWITIAVVSLLIVGGIVAFIRSRNKKKSLDEEKFL